MVYDIIIRQSPWHKFFKNHHFCTTNLFLHIYFGFHLTLNNSILLTIFCAQICREWKNHSCFSLTRWVLLKEVIKSPETTISQINNMSWELYLPLLCAWLSHKNTLSVLRIFVHFISCHFSCQKLCNSIFFWEIATF